MKVVTSSFKDVFVILPDEEWNEYPGLKFRARTDPRCGFKNWNPLSVYEGEIYMKREQMLCGMYYEKNAAEAKKLIRCVTGSVWVGIVDMRPESGTYLRGERFLLSSENGKGLYLPQGFAFGFLSESGDTTVELKAEKYPDLGAVQVLDPFDPLYRNLWPTEDIVVSVTEERKQRKG